ncbi:hypothetical protein ONS95_006397 [Cadophora gregata]|uniref:uncharacterized protein n=1 Tax=Cadophora gregata TaxID=51156 RepID=UPI0026DCE837|nr:uncharacterized protein ONS95_006397 [Cadophora gregata]KAK0102800.1 hypothetical protein ONS95_006397 [Cadophora gregata]
MQIVFDIVDDEYVDISTRNDEPPLQAIKSLQIDNPLQYLKFVSQYIDSISETLRPVNLKIHDNPELNYEEFIAHETLVNFMKIQEGMEGHAISVWHPNRLRRRVRQWHKRICNQLQC